MEENVFSRQRFEVFKGNVYNRIKEYGQIGFIKKILLSDNIEEYWNNGNSLYALYLLAMVDYLSRINKIPLYSKYDNIRQYQMEDRIYPLSIIISAKIENKDKDAFISDAIPEFLRFNIVEGDVFNVK